MMTAKIRIKARLLGLNGNGILLLCALLGVILILTVNLLPLAFENFLLPVIRNRVADITEYINIIFAAVMLFMAFLIYSAVHLGLARYYLRKSETGFADYRDIFYYYRPKTIFSAFLFEIRIFFIKGLIFLVCESPFILVFGILLFLLKNDISLTVMLILSVSSAIMFIFGCGYYKYISLSLFLAKYYFVSGKYINFRHIISLSQDTMKNKKSLVTKMTFSFLPWFFCCVFLVPIPYVFSYYQQSLGVTADMIMKNVN